jgi:hypothetical protein
MAKIDTTELSSKQRRAIAALLVKPTIASAATDCGVTQITLYRWLREDEFRQALTDAESQAIDVAARRLVQLTEAAISVIVMVLADRSAAPGIRLKAAQVVLENMLRLVEIRSISARLAELEKRL